MKDKCGWIFKTHYWAEWEYDTRGRIEETYMPTGEKFEKGIVYYQKRKCKNCGFVEMHKQEK